MRYLTILFLISFISGCANNPVQKWVEQISGNSLLKRTANIPLTEVKQPATLMVEAELDEAIDLTEISPAPLKAIEPEDSWQRIRQGLQLSSIQHSRIEKEIKRYSQHRNALHSLFNRSTPYLHFIVTEIEKRNMPTELALLPAVESGFKPFAYSPDGAAGLWQFMPATGKSYGLKQDWWQDSRRDVIASTNAALDLLENLHRRFDGDWLKALAAYNAGGGKISSAVRKNKKRGLNTDFWHLDLARETDNYIPRLLALSKIINHADRYQVTLPHIPDIPVLSTLNTGGQIDLDIAAKQLNIDTEILLDLNSNFNRWSSSPDGPHRLIVPVAYATPELEERLTNLAIDKRLRWKRHNIKQGETLSHIARKYNVSVKAIRKSNRLKSTSIRAGKDLVIPLSESVTHLALRNHKYTPKKRINYKVRGGDSLYRIAQKFKVKIADLRKWNNLNKGYIHPGQKLTVYPVQL